MSNNKKKKRKLTPEEQARRKEVLGNLGLSLKTLINNDACIKVSREWKGFKGHGVPIIVAILSVLLAALPSLTTRLSVSAGDNLFNSPNYGYDTGLTTFTKAMDENNVHVVIENGEAKIQGQKDLVFNYTEPDTNSYWYHETSTKEGSETTVFEAFYNDTANDDETFFANIAGNADAAKTPDGVNRPTTMKWNYLAIGKKGIVWAKYKESGTLALYVQGQYDRLEGVDLINATKLNTYVGDLSDRAAIANNWKPLVDKAFLTSKIQQTFGYVGIVCAVYAGMIGLFGFLIWVMTRGKQNPMRVFRIWETQRMSYWASFAPAVLAIPVGYMMSTSAIGMFAFIFLFGMRILWMSMKALRPAQ